MRPLRFRLTELRAQKQFLKRQLQDSEKTHSDIVQLVSALSGEFRVESGIESHISSHRSSSRRHTTFRAAVIAVMAANRLVYLFVQSKEFSCRAHAGSERVHIAPPESVLEVDGNRIFLILSYVDSLVIFLFERGIRCCYSRSDKLMVFSFVSTVC